MTAEINESSSGESYFKEFSVAGHPKTTVRRKISLDTSAQACEPLGFLHEKKALTPREELVTIQGVALGNHGKLVLWYSIDRLEDKEVCYYGSDTLNLLEAGFKPFQGSKTELKN
ncbi:MAG: hypothetical protein NTY31_03915 [Candidatus Falkowbacteria bacterium]|nr:hypothetical protein [Candidatus Falkowbacteria bacterium]